MRTTTVGWFPKPAEIRRARWRFAEGELDEAGLLAIESEATARAVERQEQMGLDVLVEGQFDRADMVSHFGEHLDGMELAGFVRCFGNRYYRKPVVTGGIAWRGPVTVDRWRAAASLATRPLRAIVTGPYTMMDWSLDEHYGSRERCCLAFADALREEVLALAAAGATEIEIAEPAISARAEEVALAARALARVTEGLAGRARTWTHVAYGNLEPVLGEVLRLPVDVLLLELSGAESELIRALAGLPRERELGAGVIDVLDPEVETVEVIESRIARVLAVVPRDRLWAIPDAGLRTLEPDAAEAKLAHLVEAARGV